MKEFYTHILHLFFFSCFSIAALAQQGYPSYAKLIYENGHEERIPLMANDTKQLDSLVIKLKRKGYFEAYQVADDSTNMISVHTGPRYAWGAISWSENESYLNELSNKIIKKYKAGFDEAAWTHLLDQAIEYYQNHAYPFVQLAVDSIYFEQKRFSAHITIDKKMKITYDSLQIEGDVSVNPIFLASYLQLPYGAIYRKEDVLAIEKRISQLNYLILQNAPEIAFENERCIISLELKTRKVNQFDGVMGIMPNEQAAGEVLLTGQANISLNNLFERGIYLGLDWQRIRPEKQQLMLAYEQHNVFNSNWNLSSGFQLLREDSTFLRRSFQVNVGQRISSDLLTTVYYENRFSNGLRPNLEAENIRDFRINMLGTTLIRKLLNDPIFPTKGYGFHVSAALGRKELLNAADEAGQISFHAELQLSAYKYTLFQRRWILYNRMEGASLINRQLFLNDLYQVGGLNSIRGFNQNFFLISDYVMFNHELRFLLDQQTYVFLLSDQSLQWRRLASAVSRMDKVISFGLGLSFNTGPGIFSLIYAIGRSDTQAFDPSLSKIHFGFESRF